MKIAVLVFAVAMMLSACSAKQIHIQPKESLKSISSSIVLTVDGEGVDPTVIDGLTRYITAKLIIAGFDVNRNSMDGIQLTVNVHSFEPGNAALRLTIGFGAGRGSLIYTARYVDRDG